jgi:hypothetical protein
MCIGCLAEEECIGEIIPGWYLGRAHKDYKDENLDWKIGTFGVIRCNDPDFIIPLTNIQEDPFFGWSDNDT